MLIKNIQNRNTTHDRKDVRRKPGNPLFRKTEFTEPGNEGVSIPDRNWPLMFIVHKTVKSRNLPRAWKTRVTLHLLYCNSERNCKEKSHFSRWYSALDSQVLQIMNLLFACRSYTCMYILNILKLIVELSPGIKEKKQIWVVWFFCKDKLKAENSRLWLNYDNINLCCSFFNISSSNKLTFVQP